MACPSRARQQAVRSSASDWVNYNLSPEARGTLSREERASLLRSTYRRPEAPSAPAAA